MNRRDFAKWSVGGPLALLAFLLPRKAKAKIKPKSEFPRYFCCLDGDGEPYGIYRAETSVLVFTVLPPPHGESVLRVADKWRRHPNERDATVHDAEQWVRRGYWKEITAAEAEALLRPKPIPWQPEVARRVCGNTGRIAPGGTYIGTA